ncbi:hypothetical protein GCM10010211_81250 [Streptomyces albospinus]|uniref:Uncharacterized protein n=1 Tax=Streptomyces albospinus TaxID=285515 RepID=A0ABQ2VP22_9ACTN|nr:hypothetical protein GCM10010211_81250 [Streptomyces albospinus]
MLVPGVLPGVEPGVLEGRCNGAGVHALRPAPYDTAAYAGGVDRLAGRAGGGHRAGAARAWSSSASQSGAESGRAAARALLRRPVNTCY